MTPYQFDRDWTEHHGTVAGVDEAGRGPLAGPVVAAAVVLDPRRPIDGIADSKKLTSRKRDSLFIQIREHARAFGIGEASPEEIDTHNILNATFLAMRRALAALPPVWHIALVDGNHPIRGLAAVQEPVIRGDARSASIGAASILANVTRDRYMCAQHEHWPQYDFSRHKGYPTQAHREAVRQYGMSPIHRRSFCSRLIAQTELAL